MQLFFLLMQLFIGHIVSCLHLLKEIIFFFMCILNLIFFKFGLCVFIFSRLLNFSQNCFSQHLFCVSYFYRGRSLFLTFVVHRGVVSIFSYPFLCMFTLYWVVFVNTWQKWEDLDEIWEYVGILFVLFRVR